MRTPQEQPPRRAKPPLARLDIMHLHYVSFPQRAQARAPREKDAAAVGAWSSRPPPQRGLPDGKGKINTVVAGEWVSVLGLRPYGRPPPLRAEPLIESRPWPIMQGVIREGE